MRRNKDYTFWGILGSTCGIVIAYIVYLWYVMRSKCVLENLNVNDLIFKFLTNNPGDFTWGTLGIVLTFGSLIMMIFTFRKQNAQFEEQYKMGYASRFESIFHNMMTSFYEVRRMTNVDIEKNVAECSNIQELAKKLLEDLRDNHDLTKEIPNLNKKGIKDVEIQNIRGMYGKEYEEFMCGNCNVMSNYFQYLFNMINFVIEYWIMDKELIKTYLNFIQSQLSASELCMLFYNCLSERAKDSNYKYAFFKIINDNNFLQNLDEDWLADRSNQIFYDRTRFRFLHRHEKESKAD